LAAEDDTHPREVPDLGPADDKGVDVEATAGEDAGDSRENTGFVLNEAVEDVAEGW
jgi:hypothetical protein